MAGWLWTLPQFSVEHHFDFDFEMWISFLKSTLCKELCKTEDRSFHGPEK